MAIEIKKSHRGRLHEALGIPEGDPIPLSMIGKARKSKDSSLRRMATFALNARRWKKK